MLGSHSLVALLAFTLLALVLGSGSGFLLAVGALLVGGLIASLAVLVVLAFMLLHFNSLFLRSNFCVLSGD